MRIDTKDFGVRHPRLVVAMADLSFSEILYLMTSPGYRGNKTFLFDPTKIWLSDDKKTYRSFNILDFYAN